MMDFKECQEWGERRRKEKAELNAKLEQIRREELKKQGINPPSIETEPPKYYHPNTISNGPALFITIAGMLASFIFKQWYIVWIVLIIWYGHTDRP